MLSTDTDPNETLNSEQDVAQSFEENLTKVLVIDLAQLESHKILCRVDSICLLG